MKYIINLPDDLPKNLLPVITAMATETESTDAIATRIYFHISDVMLSGLAKLPPAARVANIKIICSTLQDSLLQFTRSN